MKKFYVSIIAIISIATIVAIAVVSFSRDKSSSKLIEARNAYSVGNKNLAYDLFNEVVKKDPSCEEAFVAIAKIAEQKRNYFESQNNWEVAARLNNLKPEYKINAFKAAIISRNDRYVIEFYERSKQENFDDEILYHVGCSYLRKSDKSAAVNVLEKIKSKTFKAVLNAQISLRDSYVKLNKIEDSLSKIDVSGTGQEYIYYALALTCGVSDNLEKLKEYIDKISDAHLLIEADKRILLGRYFYAKGDFKQTISNYVKAFVLQRYNDTLALEAAELAARNFDKDAIEQIKTCLPPQSTVGSPLFYYFKTLEFAAQKDWKNTAQCLNNSTGFKDRIFYQLLSLKTAIITRDYTLLSDTLPLIKVSSLEGINKLKMAQELVEMIDFDDVDKSLNIAQKVLQLDPLNSTAKKVIIISDLHSKSFTAAIQRAKSLVDENIDDEFSCSLLLTSLFQGAEYRECLVYADKFLARNKNNSNALIFKARSLSQLKEAQKAKSIYKSLEELGRGYFDISNEIGDFYLQNNFNIDAIKFAKSLLKSADIKMQALGNFLIALNYIGENKFAVALPYFDKCISLYPDFLRARFLRANTLLALGQTDAILKAFDEIAAIDCPVELKLEFYILASYSSDSLVLEHLLEKLDSIGAGFAQEKQYNFAMAQIHHKLGNVDSAYIYAEKSSFESPAAQDIIYNFVTQLEKKSDYKQALNILIEHSKFDKNAQVLFFNCLEKYLANATPSTVDLQILESSKKIIKNSQQSQNIIPLLKKISQLSSS